MQNETNRNAVDLVIRRLKHTHKQTCQVYNRPYQG